MFGRRSTPDPADSPVATDQVEGPAGKGRATPKRKEAQAARKKRMAPPRSRKESNALHRERVKEQRTKQRQALAGGDDKYLPARDQGPVKKYVRDYIDSHRTIGEFLIPIFVVVLVLGIVLAPLTKSTPFVGTFPWVVVVAGLTIDSLRIIRGLRQGITERFGASETQGVTFYALMRAWQMRRLRLPKSTIRPGAEI